MRQTPMRRGAIPKERHQIKQALSGALAAEGVPPPLADRIAFQLVFKFEEHELERRALWSAIGAELREEIAELRRVVGLADRQIVTVLPKLSARQIGEFLDELSAADRRIARTILNAALEAADPLSAGRRYLAEYHRVAAQLTALDPKVARTIANATFTAGEPRNKAIQLLRRFTAVMAQFDEGDAPSRMLAKATFRAADSRNAAEQITSRYSAAVEHLVSQGMELRAARTLAGLRRPRRAGRQEDASGA